MELKVDGMMCMHCVNSVKDALTALNGVSDVEIVLAEKKVLLTADESLRRTVVDTIEDLGFEVEN